MTEVYRLDTKNNKIRIGESLGRVSKGQREVKHYYSYICGIEIFSASCPCETKTILISKLWVTNGTDRLSVISNFQR